MRVFTFFEGFLLDLKTMFICTCCEKDCVTIEPMESGHGITLDGGIEVTNMGSSIDIEDRRGDHYFF